MNGPKWMPAHDPQTQVFTQEMVQHLLLWYLSGWFSYDIKHK